MATLNRDTPPGGTSLLDRVFAPGVLSSLDRMRLRISRASGDRPGHTRVRGRTDPSGSELDRWVPYVAGEDLRRVDWHVYARLGELLVRRFVAEREVPVWILIDSSGSMGPAGAGSKLDTAAAVAGLLGAICLAGGERVYLGAIPHGTRDFSHCGPLRSRTALGTLHAFLGSLAPAAGEGDLVAAVETALRLTTRGLVVLVSDFLIDPGLVARAADVIVRRGCEGRLVTVLSREDHDPAWLRGRDRIVDRESGRVRRITPSVETWQRYRDALEHQLAQVREAATSHGMATAFALSGGEIETLLRDELPKLGLALVR